MPCLAIETSGRFGSVTRGDGDGVIATVDLPEQQRHAVELMPAIDSLCTQHSLSPADVGEIHVSIGPGSFTGLRIGITTAKTLAWLSGAKLVAVPTLDVVVQNAPPDIRNVAVMLNAKRGQCFTGIFTREGGSWRPLIEPSLLTPAEMLEHAPRPLAVIADKLPDGTQFPADVQLLNSSLARPRSSAVWAIGRALAKQGSFADPVTLAPLYVRLPEAEEVWLSRQS